MPGHLPSATLPVNPPPGPRGRRAVRAAAAAAVLTGLLAGPGGTPVAFAVGDAGQVRGAGTARVQHVSHEAVAARGADWMARQIRANSGYLSGFGVPDVNDTAYAVIGLNAVGGHRRASTEALGYLRRHVSSLTSGEGSDNPAALAYFILAGVSAGADVAHFGGSKPANDLPARLLRTVRLTGSDSGLVGTADPTYDGAFRQGLALAALSATAPGPRASRRVRLAVRWLERQQCANGLWQAYRSDTDVPCAAADPATFSGPDTNSTSLAVQGLHAYGLSPRRWNVIRSLHAVQSSDGGFPYLAAPGQASDPNSTALSIQAVLAERRSLKAASWRKDGVTAYDALASYQLGRGRLGRRDAPADRGAFFYGDIRTPSVLATVQAVPAAAGRTLPVRG